MTPRLFRYLVRRSSKSCCCAATTLYCLTCCDLLARVLSLATSASSLSEYLRILFSAEAVGYQLGVVMVTPSRLATAIKRVATVGVDPSLWYHLFALSWPSAFSVGPLNNLVRPQSS
jgi:hypothetical protein